MASAFSDSLMASEISGTTKGMTVKFLPDVGVYKEKNKKNFHKQFGLTKSPL